MDNGATMHLAVSLFPGTADPSPEPELDRLARFAQKAEAAGLDMVLLADAAPASGGEAANRQVPFEATTLLAALATVTSRIGLVAMASTIAHQPYNLARRFASIDIFSHGRAGWHATMVQVPREAANFSRPEDFSRDDFRRRTEEYIGIVQGLWQGWEADALSFDKGGGRFHDPTTHEVPTRIQATRQWLCCVLSFKGRKRKVWGRGYTELFFCDEVTAFAAGHRPCMECRRQDALTYRAALVQGLGLLETPLFPEVDRILDADRLDGRTKRVHRLPAERLPDGAMLQQGNESFAIVQGRAHSWSPAGYRAEQNAPQDAMLLTPPSTLRALSAGYRPVLHPSAGT